jgi:hypothetical protein
VKLIGQTSGVGPCLDLSMAAMLYFREAGIPVTFLMEEVTDRKYGPTANMVHFALELIDPAPNAGLAYVNFSHENHVFVGIGPYRNEKEGAQTVRLWRIPESRISPEEPFYNALGLKSLDSIADVDTFPFPAYDAIGNQLGRKGFENCPVLEQIASAAQSNTWELHDRLERSGALGRFKTHYQF